MPPHPGSRARARRQARRLRASALERGMNTRQSARGPCSRWVASCPGHAFGRAPSGMRHGTQMLPSSHCHSTLPLLITPPPCLTYLETVSPSQNPHHCPRLSEQHALTCLPLLVCPPLAGGAFVPGPFCLMASQPATPHPDCPRLSEQPALACLPLPVCGFC